MARDGYRIFDSDTHVGPDAAILSAYLSEAEKAWLAGWEPYRATGRNGHVTWAALWDFMTAFQERGTAAWDEFVASREDRPYPHPVMPPGGEGADKQRMLEERYLSDAALAKYRRG